MAYEYVDLDAAREELELAGVDGFMVKIGGREYEFPPSMHAGAYMDWNEALVEHIRSTGMGMHEWSPDHGIPPNLAPKWLQAALSPDQYEQMIADDLTIDQMNAAAEYLYMRYVGVPALVTEDGDGSQDRPIRSLQPSF